MSTFTYKELPQLQAFVFTDATNRGYELVRGYRGASVLIKLSDSHLWGLRWPFPTKQEDNITTQVSPKHLKAPVIPADPGMDQNALHAAIVDMGFGRLLINLEN